MSQFAKNILSIVIFSTFPNALRCSIFLHYSMRQARKQAIFTKKRALNARFLLRNQRQIFIYGRNNG